MQTTTIPAAVMAAYEGQFPHLRVLGERARAGDLRASLTFAQLAGQLTSPPGVSMRDLLLLAKIAERQMPAIVEAA